MTEPDRIVALVQAMLRLPFFQSLPGAVLEEILAHVYRGKRPGTYDFADVVSEDTHTGWQVKSTRVNTPVTWKRAKLPNKKPLIEASQKSTSGAQVLGDAIIDLCNHSAIESVRKYGLKKLGYARLVDYMDGRLMYFERELPISGLLFDPKDFTWSWSTAKKTSKKEQLSAFHGFHTASRRPWFAWHGLGENQLHFKGESAWWPENGTATSRNFDRAGEVLKLADVAKLITSYKAGSSSAK